METDKHTEMERPSLGEYNPRKMVRDPGWGGGTRNSERERDKDPERGVVEIL